MKRHNRPPCVWFGKPYPRRTIFRHEVVSFYPMVITTPKRQGRISVCLKAKLQLSYLFSDRCLLVFAEWFVFQTSFVSFYAASNVPGFSKIRRPLGRGAGHQAAKNLLSPVSWCLCYSESNFTLVSRISAICTLAFSYPFIPAGLIL